MNKKESKYVLKILISDSNIKKSRKRAAGLQNSKKKISSGGELYGLLAEELFLDNYGGTLIDNKDYDISHDKIGRIDVKTKRCSSPPEEHYTCSVAEYQLNNDCDYYAFYRIHKNLNAAWFLGIISKSEFLSKATKLNKGDTDGNFICKANCYNVKISDLKTISEVMI
jgi:hypothetical protein